MVREGGFCYDWLKKEVKVRAWFYIWAGSVCGRKLRMDDSYITAIFKGDRGRQQRKKLSNRAVRSHADCVLRQGARSKYIYMYCPRLSIIISHEFLQLSPDWSPRFHLWPLQSFPHLAAWMTRLPHWTPQLKAYQWLKSWEYKVQHREYSNILITLYGGSWRLHFLWWAFYNALNVKSFCWTLETNLIW